MSLPVPSGLERQHESKPGLACGQVRGQRGPEPSPLRPPQNSQPPAKSLAEPRGRRASPEKQRCLAGPPDLSDAPKCCCFKSLARKDLLHSSSQLIHAFPRALATSRPISRSQHMLSTLTSPPDAEDQTRVCRQYTALLCASPVLEASDRDTCVRPTSASQEPAAHRGRLY